MAFMDWDGSLALGDAMIDRQHQTLVELINRVHEVGQSPERDMEIIASINAMFLYAKEHFFDEEGLMARLNYPGRAAHALLHKDFVEKTQNFADACLADDEDCGMDDEALLRFLVDWLTQHIAVEDAKIVRFASALRQPAA
jgi:hemerythrin